MTAGVGPWLPFQMLVLGLGRAWAPGCCRAGSPAAPRSRCSRRTASFASYAFGLLMNLSGWPFLLGIAVPGHEGSLSYVARRADGREPAPRSSSTRCSRRPAAGTPMPRDHHRGRDRGARARPILATLRRAARRATVVGTTESSGLDDRRIRSSPAAGGRGRRGCWWSPRAGRRGRPRRCASGRTRRRRSPPGWAASPSASTSIRHSRSPRSEASQRWPSSQASPDGEASSVSQTTCGSTKPASVAARPRPSASRSCRPRSIRLSSSKVFCPNSEAHSRSSSSNARPWTLRWP